jgi:hypothetical protein
LHGDRSAGIELAGTHIGIIGGNAIALGHAIRGEPGRLRREFAEGRLPKIGRLYSGGKALEAQNDGGQLHESEVDGAAGGEFGDQVLAQKGIRAGLTGCRYGNGCGVADDPIGSDRNRHIAALYPGRNLKSDLV